MLLRPWTLQLHARELRGTPDDVADLGVRDGVGDAPWEGPFQCPGPWSDMDKP